MAILVAMFYGLIAGAIGFVLGAVLASIAASVLHLSHMEGATGYLAAGVGSLSGLSSMIAVMVWTLRSRGITTFAGVLGGSLGGVAGLIALAAAGFGLYYLNLPHYLRANGLPVYLNFEIAAPAGQTEPDLSQWSTEIHTPRNNSIGYWKNDHAEMVDGHPVLSGSVELHFRTQGREVVLYPPNQQRISFYIPIPSDPTAAKFQHWSEWKKADSGDGSGAYRLRYAVETMLHPIGVN